MIEDEIASRLAEVRARMAAAEARAGRAPDSTRLVLASKTRTAEEIRAAYIAGARDFGENYAQEGAAKRAALATLSGVRWHMIGHLQSNKARLAANTFDLIQSLDSATLAAALARVRPSPPVRVLIEVNIGAERSKSGVAPEAVEALIAGVRDRVAIEGLMTIPPQSADSGGARAWFAELRQLRDRLARSCGLALSELSMGMTDDYEGAIEEGATIVRVGRAVFGERRH